MKKNILLLATLLLLCSVSFAQKTITTYYDYKHTEKHEVYITNNYGVKNGAYTEYSEYGGIIQQGTYKNDKMVGKWILNDKNGKKQMEGSFDNDGQYNGQVVMYKNGYKYSQENYKHGIKDGHCKYWFCNRTAYGEDNQAGDPNFDPENVSVYLKADGSTQLKYDEYYKNDLLDSVRNEYNENGVLISQTWYKFGVAMSKDDYENKPKPGERIIAHKFTCKTIDNYGTMVTCTADGKDTLMTDSKIDFTYSQDNKLSKIRIEDPDGTEFDFNVLQYAGDSINLKTDDPSFKEAGYNTFSFKANSDTTVCYLNLYSLFEGRNVGTYVLMNFFNCPPNFHSLITG